MTGYRGSHDDDVIKWKHFPRYWPFVWGIHQSPVNSPHKGQWRGALMFSLISVWMNGWVNTREAGDYRRHRAHFDVGVMTPSNCRRATCPIHFSFEVIHNMVSLYIITSHDMGLVIFHTHLIKTAYTIIAITVLILYHKFIISDISSTITRAIFVSLVWKCCNTILHTNISGSDIAFDKNIGL